MDLDKFQNFVIFMKNNHLYFSKGEERSFCLNSLSLVFNEKSYWDYWKEKNKIININIFKEVVDFLKEYEEYIHITIQTEKISKKICLDIKDEYSSKALKIQNIEEAINLLKNEAISLGAEVNNDDRNILEIPDNWYNWELQMQPLNNPIITLVFKEKELYKIAEKESFDPSWE